MATYPVQFNSCHIVSLPILAHFINIYSFHANLITDLNVRGGGGRGQCHQASNMDTTWFHSSENVYFEPFQWLGLMYYLVEICHNVCFSLWDTSLLWRLSFSLDTGYFYQTATCPLIMFIIMEFNFYMLELCNISWNC